MRKKEKNGWMARKCKGKVYFLVMLSDILKFAQKFKIFYF